MDNQNKWQNIPNILCLIRIALIPIIILLIANFGNDTIINQGNYQISLRWIFGGLIFGLAVITDKIDGYIARKYKVESQIGSFLDTIADKFLAVAVLICFASFNVVYFWVVVILVLRDLYSDGLKMILLTNNVALKASIYGRVNAGIKFAGIFILFYVGPEQFPKILSTHDHELAELALIPLYISCVLGIGSAMQYTIANFKHLKIINK